MDDPKDAGPRGAGDGGSGREPGPGSEPGPQVTTAHGYLARFYKKLGFGLFPDGKWRLLRNDQIHRLSFADQIRRAESSAEIRDKIIPGLPELGLGCKITERLVRVAEKRAAVLAALGR